MSGSQKRASAGSDERRRAHRHDASTLPSLSARLVAGHDVTLLDVSEGGARFESNVRLLPGSTVSLRLVTGETVFTALARVMRSRVARVESGGLRYESAVAFDKKFPLQEAHVANARDEDGASDHGLPDLGAVPADYALSSSDILTCTAVVQADGPDVRQILASNRW